MAETSGNSFLASWVLHRKASKNHSLLNHPLWLVVNSLIALSPGQDYSEILCKRMSWIVAQTIAKQLPSVVKTSI